MNMRKKTVLIVVCSFLISSTAFAAPLTDYSVGKASIDLNYRNTEQLLDSDTYGRKYNLEPSVTIGIADKWAFQYRYKNLKSKSTTFNNGISYQTVNLCVNEFNLLYSLTPNVSLFVGRILTDGAINVSVPGWGQSETWGWTSLGQVGLLGSVPLTDKISAYGVVGISHRWTNFEVGLSYAFTKNWEFNVDYREMKKTFGEVDVKAKGLGFGVTYKFQ